MMLKNFIKFKFIKHIMKFLDIEIKIGQVAIKG